MSGVWGKGNYAIVAERLMPAAQALVEAAGIDSQQTVLDVAAGTGNVALVAAERHAIVTATDFSPEMIELGEQRVIGGNVMWLEADAQDLPFEDASFDAALSAFGAMFAPDAETATAELLRVVRPGGVVGMTTWIDEGMQAEVVGLLAEAGDGPRIVNRWSEEAFIREQFAGVAGLTVQRRELPWEWESAEAVADFFETGPPPIAALREKLGDDWAPVRERIIETAGKHLGEAGGTPYWLIIARR